MKKTKLFLLLCCLTFTAAAQQDFQGTIHYKATRLTGLEEGEDSTMNITMRLAPNRILFTVNKENEEDVLIMLDSLKILKIDKETSTYRTTRIYKVRPMLPGENETIAGYRTTPQQITGGTDFSSFSMRSQTWTADDLYYHLPAGAVIQDFMMFFKNDRIVLKALLSFGDFDEEELEEGKEDGLSTKNFRSEVELKAYEVIPGILPASLFEIPQGYTQSDIHFPRTGDFRVDTIEMPMVDTTVMVTEPPVPPPPPQKPTKTPAKTKTKTTSPARKDD